MLVLLDGKSARPVFLGNPLSRNHFDHSLCLWNTLGNVQNEEQVLKELGNVTAGSIFSTVFKKGTLSQRKNWYATVGVPIQLVDEENVIFYSQSRLISKSYNENDLMTIGAKAGLRVAESRILNGVMIWTEYRKESVT